MSDHGDDDGQVPGARGYSVAAAAGAMNASSPIPIKRGGADANESRSSAPAMAASPSHAPATPSSPWRYGSPPSSLITTTTPSSRPTKDEASALWEIMSTPPQSYIRLCSQDGRGRDKADRRVDMKRSQSLPSSAAPSLLYAAQPALVSPKGLASPPYESSLPHKPAPASLSARTLRSGSGKRYSLEPRSSFPPVRGASIAQQSCCQNYGLGPYLSLLPESIVFSIVAYIDFLERHPTLLLVSHGLTRLLVSPSFLFEMKHVHHVHQGGRKEGRGVANKGRGLLSRVLRDQDDQGAGEGHTTSSNELLLIVGGKCPTKAKNNAYSNSNQRGGDVQFMAAATASAPAHRPNRRMEMQNNEQSGIFAYDQRMKKWLRFGGDPLEPLRKCDGGTNSPNEARLLHPLSPFGIVDAKPLYVGHPCYSLVFFGGTHYQTGAPSSRVVAYSFLSGRWERWPDMMRARHGEDFVVARVDGGRERGIAGDKEGEGLGSACGDCIVLIGCDLEFCDCFRCNPPPCASDQSESAKVNIEAVFMNSDSGSAGVDSNNDHYSGRARKRSSVDFETMGRCEVLDLNTRRWERRKARAPSCPPDDGGVAVIGGRYIYLPGTCPPPPNAATFRGLQEDCSLDRIVEAVTPMTQSEVNSRAERSKSTSSTIDDNDQLSTTSMDTAESGENIEDDEIIPLFRSLYYRPGLRYDCWLDQWSTLPARPYVTTSSPTTVSFRDHVVVLAGYRSSSENALSCYRHREEDSILDYEDHLDYSWWFAPPPSRCDPKHGEAKFGDRTQNDDCEWNFGGGTTTLSHRQSWAHSSDMAAAVAAASAMKSEMDGGGTDSKHSAAVANLPCVAPVPVRGATATLYQDRLTMLGGLSTFSRTFYDSERKTIWQFIDEEQTWRRAPMTLPVPALLGGYAFSVHI